MDDTKAGVRFRNFECSSSVFLKAAFVHILTKAGIPSEFLCLFWPTLCKLSSRNTKPLKYSFFETQLKES
jgi:hypothetical protein